MIVLGIESSCDETGVALVQTQGDALPSLLAQALHSQTALHQAYGGVVPELASRDHVRRVLPLARDVLAQAQVGIDAVDVVAYTRGPGLAGALLVGAGFACALGAGLGKPVLGVHHLEGHLLSPFLARDPPAFPFVALLVSGGHTQLMRVDDVGRYELLGETIDDAAGEAFDKSAKMLGLPYPGGPALARLADAGRAEAFKLPRPLLHSANLDFSFAGLKTAVMTQLRKCGDDPGEGVKADLAAATQQAIVDVLVHKALAALEATGLERLVVAGGVRACRSAHRAARASVRWRRRAGRLCVRRPAALAARRLHIDRAPRDALKRLANALAALAPHGHEGAAARLLGVIGAPLAQGGRERPTCARLFVQRAGPAALAQADELVPVLVQGVERLRGALRL